MPTFLKWRRTWEDKPYDFVGFDEQRGSKVGRIYRDRSFSQTLWRWFGQGRYGKRLYTSTGSEPTREAAIAKLEAGWLSMIEDVDRENANAPET